jgi:hypothetical protein
MFSVMKEGQYFMESKEKPVREFQDPQWTCEFVFLVDITGRSNELNCRLRGKDQLIHALYNFIKDFQTKRDLRERQLKANYNAYFLT